MLDSMGKLYIMDPHQQELANDYENEQWAKWEMVQRETAGLMDDWDDPNYEERQEWDYLRREDPDFYSLAMTCPK